MPDNLGRFVKGEHPSPKTEYKKGSAKPKNAFSFYKGYKISKEAIKKRSEKRKGQKHSLKSKIQMSKSHIGLQAMEKHPMWKGEKSIDSDGYIRIKNNTHPNRTSNNYIYEHRLNAEKLINRPIKKTEIVHHINSNKLDNRPGNLMIFKNQSAHIKWHIIQNGLDKSDIIYSP